MLIVITLDKLITLSELSFPLIEAIFREWNMLKLPITDYIIWLITFSVITLSIVTSTYCKRIFYITITNFSLQDNCESSFVKPDEDEWNRMKPDETGWNRMKPDEDECTSVLPHLTDWLPSLQSKIEKTIWAKYKTEMF